MYRKSKFQQVQTWENEAVSSCYQDLQQEFCWCDKSESLLIQQASGTEFLGTFLLPKFKVMNTHGTFPLHAPKTDPYCRSTCVNRAQFCQPLKCAHFYYPRDKHMEFTWIVFTEQLVGTASFCSWYSVVPWSETSLMKLLSFVTIRGFGNRKMSHFFSVPTFIKLTRDLPPCHSQSNHLICPVK